LGHPTGLRMRPLFSQHSAISVSTEEVHDLPYILDDPKQANAWLVFDNLLYIIIALSLDRSIYRAADFLTWHNG